MKKSYNKSFDVVLKLPRYVKRFIAILVDLSLCLMATWGAFSLRFNEFVQFDEELIFTFLISAVLALPIFVSYGLYRAIFRYHGLPAIYELVKANAVYFLLFSCTILLLRADGIPRSVGFIQPLLLFLFVWLSRSAVQFSLSDFSKRKIMAEFLPRALIYGAGHTGRQLALSLRNSVEMNAVGFIDDDETIQGQQLHGYKVYSLQQLSSMIENQNVSYVLLAMPSIGRRLRNEILKKLSKYNLAVRTVPSVTDVALGRVTKSELLNLNLEDLLGRELVEPDKLLLQKNILNKCILVTGAGGSIGSELCRQIINLKCKKLILLDFDEFSLYTIHSELNLLKSQLFEDEEVEIVPILASVQKKNLISSIFKTWKPDTVYHAAAYKHVHLVESNLEEGIINNVFPAISLAEAAIEHNVSDFVFISSDKAVRPTSMMGASKRLAEIALQSFFNKQHDKTKCNLAIVRFGNVIGSSGSVIPKFRKQIQEGGPITLTHPDVTRYFMTIPEAAQLVIQAAAMEQKGDIYILDMGEPIKIIELAQRMIELSGLSVQTPMNPSGDIEILITGLQPGEKLYEELLIENDAKKTEHPKVLWANDQTKKWDKIAPKLDELKMHLDTSDMEKIVKIIVELVPNYRPSDEISRWIN